MISSQDPSALICGHFLGSQEFLGDGLQPILRDIGLVGAEAGFDAPEDLGEHLVEPIEQSFVLHEGGARQPVEFLGSRSITSRSSASSSTRCSFIEAGMPAARSSSRKLKNMGFSIAGGAGGEAAIVSVIPMSFLLSLRRQVRG
jgi:hypothetical protein